MLLFNLIFYIIYSYIHYVITVLQFWWINVYIYNNVVNFFRHYKSPLFHTVIRILLISLSFHILVILPSYFSSMEQMLICELMFVLNYLIWTNVNVNVNLWIVKCCPDVSHHLAHTFETDSLILLWSLRLSVRPAVIICVAGVSLFIYFINIYIFH